MKNINTEDLKCCHFILNSIKNILEDQVNFCDHHLYKIIEDIENDDLLFINKVTHFLMIKILNHLSINILDCRFYKL